MSTDLLRRFGSAQTSADSNSREQPVEVPRLLEITAIAVNLVVIQIHSSLLKFCFINNLMIDLMNHVPLLATKTRVLIIF